MTRARRPAGAKTPASSPSHTAASRDAPRAPEPRPGRIRARLPLLPALALLLGALSLFHAAPAAAQTIPSLVNDGYAAQITNFTVTPGSEKLTLSWTSAQSWNRGIWVQYKTSAASSWTFSRSSGESSPYEITNLVAGTAYDVRIFGVVCCNAGNDLIRSAFITGSGTPLAAPVAPAAPTGLIVSPGDGKLDLRWTKPAGTVTGYDVDYTSSTTVAADAAAVSSVSTGWVAHTRVATLTTAAHSVTPLTNGTPYRVRVRAKNAAGAGPWVTDGGTPRAKPTITSFTASPGDSKLDLSWVAPADITRVLSYSLNYTLSMSVALDAGAGSDVNTSWVGGETLGGSATTHSLTGLNNDSTYRVRLHAVALVGAAPVTTDFVEATGTPSAQQTVTPPSTDADLTALSVSSATASDGTFMALTLSPATFAAATTEYTASVPNAQTHAKLAWTLSDSNATVKVGKGTSLTTTTAAASGAIELDVGANALKVEVTAEDGGTPKTYTVTVTRAQQTTGLAAPTNLDVSAGNGQLSLTWAAPTGVTLTGYDVHYTSADAGTVGNDVAVQTTGTPTAASGWLAVTRSGTTASQTISSLDNGTDYRVRVRAKTSSEDSAWVFGTGRPGSSDADLSALTASTGTSSSGTFTALTLSPATFAAATTAYTGSVANAQTHAKITPTVNDSNATVEVGEGSSLTGVTSGSASTAIPLSVGANAITVKVTAQDGSTTKTYTVTVTRRAQPEKVVFGYDLSPSFPFNLSVDEGAGTVRVPITVSALPATSLTVAVSATDVTTGSADHDFSAQKTVTFRSTDSSRTRFVEFSVTDDSVQEGTEVLRLGLSIPQRGPSIITPYDIVVDTASDSADAFVNIVDNDGPSSLTGKTFAITPSVTVAEGASATLTVTLGENAPTDGLSFTVTPSYCACGPNAVTRGAVAADVGTVPSTVTVSAGSKTATLTIPIAADELVESSEHFSVTIATATTGWTAAATGANSATVIITDVSATPTVSFELAALLVNESDTAPADIKVQLSAARTESVTVGIGVKAGATADAADYTLSATSVTFAVGETEKTITVLAAADMTTEGSEEAVLTLTGVPSGIELGTNAEITLTFVDDSLTPTVSLSAAPNPVEEGSAVTVTATLSAPAASALTIPVTVTDGSAESGDHGSLTSIAVAAQATSGTGAITTVVDEDVEDETFTVALGTLPDGYAAGSPDSVEVMIADSGGFDLTVYSGDQELLIGNEARLGDPGDTRWRNVQTSPGMRWVDLKPTWSSESGITGVRATVRYIAHGVDGSPLAWSTSGTKARLDTFSPLGSWGHPRITLTVTKADGSDEYRIQFQTNSDWKNANNVLERLRMMRRAARSQ